jgi:predicted  nucleic acid-binding Zn-ribbon protein
MLVANTLHSKVGSQKSNMSETEYHQGLGDGLMLIGNMREAERRINELKKKMSESAVNFDQYTQQLVDLQERLEEIANFLFVNRFVCKTDVEVCSKRIKAICEEFVHLRFHIQHKVLMEETAQHSRP